MAGFEPTNAGVKVLCLNQLGDIPSYKNNGVDSRIRTDGLQSHNLAL